MAFFLKKLLEKNSVEIPRRFSEEISRRFSKEISERTAARIANKQKSWRNFLKISWTNLKNHWRFSKGIRGIFFFWQMPRLRNSNNF